MKRMTSIQLLALTSALTFPIVASASELEPTDMIVTALKRPSLERDVPN